MGKTIFDFSNQVAVITGAALGIGKRSAECFAEAGAKVFLIDIDAKGGTSAAQRIQAQGGDAHFFECDVTKAACGQASLRNHSEQGGPDRHPRQQRRRVSYTARNGRYSGRGMGCRCRPEPEKRFSHGESSHPYLSETAERAHHQPGIDGGAHHLQSLLSPLFSRQGGGSLPHPGPCL